jgi:serine/threonine-protein kinase RsbW
MRSDLPQRRQVDDCTTPDCLERVCVCLTELWELVPEVPERDRNLFETAVTEVVANVVAHAGGGPDFDAHVEIEVNVDVLSARTEDNGAEADVDLDAPMPALGMTHGRGVPLARAALDDLLYERRDGRNVWLLRRRWSANGRSSG